uniref:UBC core domain-containing protein n=1 Tax=Timema genevievae TaxID=629358 RepID=A0A7R9K3D3_TIMGE|nr:unnamed protein product [Timema genevievae]
MDSDDHENAISTINEYFEKNCDAKNTLIKEIRDWCDGNNNSITFLSNQTCENDQIRLNLIIGDGNHFSIVCPQNYPNQEANFFVESTVSLQLWCNELNEFIFDSTEVLTLTSILNKAASSYYKKLNEPIDLFTSDSDQTSEEELMEREVEVYMDLDLDLDDSEIDFCYMKKKWEQKETRLRAEKAKELASEVTQFEKCNESSSLEEKKKSNPKQIFSTSAASGILTNDLVTLLKSKEDNGIKVKPINDNIYQWSVKFSKFDPESALHRDLQELKEKHGYDYIELQMEFTMDLYPFYPPIAKILRPRLQSSMMLQVANMEVLKLSRWNPARSMESVLHEIKEYMSTWGRVDLLSPRNCPQQHTQGAYINLERHVMLLACISEMSLQDLATFHTATKTKHSDYSSMAVSKMFPDFNFNVDISLKEFKANCPHLSKKKELPKGVGYSQPHQPSWDINSFHAAHREKNNQLSRLLKTILEELNTQRLSLTSINKDAVHSKILNTNGVPISTEFSQQSSECSEHSCEGEKPHIYFREILESSSLFHFLASQLQVDSFLEVTHNAELYTSIINLIKEISCWPQLVSLLWTLPNQTHSIYKLICRVNEMAQVVIKRVDKLLTHDDRRVSSSEGKKSTTVQGGLEKKLVESLQDVCQHLKVSLTQYEAPDSKESDTPEPFNTVQSNPSSTNSFNHTYTAALKDMQFLTCDIDIDGANAHWFSSTFKKNLPPSSSQIMRIVQEMASLSTSLPLDSSSAIFVRTDDARFTLLRALIIGPEGTPYSGGCFQFDIFFPSFYPAEPPNVHFCTTGHSRVRFNPNLYHDGKVCLSLLNTWPGEKWHKDTSTLLQVLISIQSLIFVPEPFFNEPGMEYILGTEKGKQASDEYSDDILVKTVTHAMIGQLKSPSPGFEDIIKKHFILKKDIIIRELEGHYKRNSSQALNLQLNILKKEFSKLE